MGLPGSGTCRDNATDKGEYRDGVSYFGRDVIIETQLPTLAHLDLAFEEHSQALAATRQVCPQALNLLAAAAVECLAAGGKILFFGNGGSAADSQHLAAELTIRLVRNRRALAAIALTTDSSALTACANDYGFEQIFARQLEALGRPGDLAIGFSTSGNSPNVVAALERARHLGIRRAAFTGFSGGRLAELVEILVAVPSVSSARIQEMHILLGHILCTEIEQRLALDA